MNSILELFAQKIFKNLMQTNKETPEKQRIIVDSSLETLNKYVVSQASCQRLAETPLMKKVIADAQTQVQILQDPSQFKQLSSFYKTLATFWLFDHNELVFERNIS